SRCRAPSAPARRRPSGSAGCCGPSRTGTRRTSTPWSPGTPLTRTSRHTASGSWRSRATRTGSWTRTSCWPTAERGRCLPAADARLLAVLAVLAEEDDVEGGAQEDPDGAHGVTETVRAAAAQ